MDYLLQKRIGKLTKRNLAKLHGHTCQIVGSEVFILTTRISLESNTTLFRKPLRRENRWRKRGKITGYAQDHLRRTLSKKNMIGKARFQGWASKGHMTTIGQLNNLLITRGSTLKLIQNIVFSLKPDRSDP